MEDRGRLASCWMKDIGRIVTCWVEDGGRTVQPWPASPPDGSMYLRFRGIDLPASNLQFKNNCFIEMFRGTEAGSYLRRIDSCITQLKAQGPARTCNESKEKEKEDLRSAASR